MSYVGKIVGGLAFAGLVVWGADHVKTPANIEARINGEYENTVRYVIMSQIIQESVNEIEGHREYDIRPELDSAKYISNNQENLPQVHIERLNQPVRIGRLDRQRMNTLSDLFKKCIPPESEESIAYQEIELKEKYKQGRIREYITEGNKFAAKLYKIGKMHSEESAKAYRESYMRKIWGVLSIVAGLGMAVLTVRKRQP